MAATMSKNRPKPTADEASYIVAASERIAWYGEDVPCPRCEKKLLYNEFGNSYEIACSDEDCIRMGFRGL